MHLTRKLALSAGALAMTVIMANCASTSDKTPANASVANSAPPANAPAANTATQPVAPVPAKRHSITPTYKATVNDLAWMHGEWIRESSKGNTAENFGTASGGTILGTSRIVAQGRTVHQEFMSLTERDG